MARGRILLVEDEPMLHLLWEDICEDNDIELVGPAMTNAEAERLIQQEAGSLLGVFLDVNLMGESSLGAAELLSNMPLPVVVCSGHNERDIPLVFQQWPVLQKPYRPLDIEQLINKLVFAN